MIADPNISINAECPPTRRVLLTGCTGFIGSYVLSELLRRGYQVYTVVRNASRVDQRLLECASGKLILIESDLLREQDVSRLRDEVLKLPGLNFVIHTVGGGPLTSNSKFASEINDLNYQTTVNLVKALEDAGKFETLSAFVYFSSLAAMGTANGSNGAVIYKETSACTPVLPYERAKFRTEEFLKELNSRYKMKVVILRFPQIYGRKDDSLMEIIGLIRKGIFPVVRNRIGSLPLLHVSDAAKAVCTVLGQLGKIPDNYDLNLVCENSYSYAQLEQIVRSMHGSGRLLPLPYSMLYVLISALEVGFRIMGRPEPLNRSRLKSMTKKRVVDCDKFVNRFNFQFDHDLETFLSNQG